MDKKALPIGISSYEKLISNDYYFVDKTLLIKDFLESILSSPLYFYILTILRSPICVNVI